MKKSLSQKIIKFRKLILINKKHFNINYKYILLCDFNSFNGLALKLLKSYLLDSFNMFNFKPFKILFNTNLFVNNNFLKNIVYFKFNCLNDILNLIDFFKHKTLIPFLIYPLYIININKNIIFSLKNLKNNYLKINSLNNIIYSKIIYILKKLFLNILFQLSSKIKKCLL
jgi:hypothetical protein